MSGKKSGDVAKTKIGRPTLYTEELGQEICAKVAAGQDVKSVCAEAGISLGTLHLWREVHPAFLESYTRARARSGESAESDVQVVLNDLKAGRIDPNAARVLLDGLRWLAGKRAPRTHGDRVEVEHSGSVQGMGAVQITISPATPLAPAMPAVLDVLPMKPALPCVEE